MELTNIPQQKDPDKEDDEINNELAKRTLRKFRERTVRFEPEPIPNRFSKWKATETQQIKTSATNSMFHTFQDYAWSAY